MNRNNIAKLNYNQSIMNRISTIIIMLLLVLTVSAQEKVKGVKEFQALYTQTLDPDPRNAGNWFIGEIKELKEPLPILYSKNYIRVHDVSYFIDKSTLKTKQYTPEENVGYGMSTAFAATSLTGETIFVTMEYGNREDARLYGFSIFNRANQGHFYLAQIKR